MDNYYSTLIFQAKELFQKRIEQFGSDPYSLIQHVIEAEKWANYILKSDTPVNRSIRYDFFLPAAFAACPKGKSLIRYSWQH